MAAGDVLEQLERAHAKGARAAVIFASGFAETDDAESAARQAALVHFVERTGMAINGPNSIGVVNWRRGIFATFARAFAPSTPPGRNALIGQSGNIASAIYRIAQHLGLRFGYAINTGNEADANISDYLSYMAGAPDADAILCYIESLRDGPGFLAAARDLRSQGKLLAVYKSGSTAKGAEATRSHTASLAGNYVAYQTAFQACGAAVAQDLTHMADLAYMHGFSSRSVGLGVGIVSVSGAACAIVADGLVSGGMTIPTLPEPVQTEIQKYVPAFGMAANPVDLTGNVTNQAGATGAVLDQIIRADAIDVLFLYLGPLSLKGCITRLAEIIKETGKLVVVVDTSESGMRGELEAIGVPFFEDLSRAIRAVTTYTRWRLEEPAGIASGAAPIEAVRSQFQRVAAGAQGTGLSEVASKSLLTAAGVNVVRDILVQDAAAAIREADQIGYPVVMKIVSPDLAHKTEVGGVKLGLDSPEMVEAAYDAIMASVTAAAPSARLEGVSVEPQILDARELLVGVTRDPVFGWMMTVGIGGIWTELIGDVRHALLPVDAAGAERLLRGLKTFPLLDGFRGSPPADIDAACQAIAAISDLVLTLGDRIVDCEVNPLLVLPKGRGAIAADALITLARGG
jgi:acyl-CoA synthetase (NDP forming)